MTDPTPWTPEFTQADLKHYREPYATSIDLAWMKSDLQCVSIDARYTWLRLISGPENIDGHVDVDLLSPQDFPDLIRDLRELQAIDAVRVNDGRITFPNLAMGAPPAEEVDA